MEWKDVALTAVGFLQVVGMFILAYIFSQLNKLEADKQDKGMCEKVHLDVEKSLARGDVKFTEVMAELRKFSDVFLEIKLQLASVVQQLQGIEKRKSDD